MYIHYGMGWLNRQIKEYFQISRSEANGVLVLVPLILICLFLPVIYKKLMINEAEPIHLDRIIFDSLIVELKKDSVQHQVWPKSNFFYKKKAESKKYNRTTPTFIHEQLKPFDLNLADTIQLMKVRGIGPVLSNRIVKYRKLLGGFVNVGQLNEIYNLSDSVLLSLDTLTFVQEVFQIKKLPLNDVSAKELMRHPYITPKIAWAIINYRDQHGVYTNANEIKKIHSIDGNTFNKILPYLSIQSAE